MKSILYTLFILMTSSVHLKAQDKYYYYQLASEAYTNAEYEKAGDFWAQSRDEALKNRIDNAAIKSYPGAEHTIAIYAARSYSKAGVNSKALKYLNLAFEDGEEYSTMILDPSFNNIRNLPEFDKFIKRIKLPGVVYLFEELINSEEEEEINLIGETVELRVNGEEMKNHFPFDTLRNQVIVNKSITIKNSKILSNATPMRSIKFKQLSFIDVYGSLTFFDVDASTFEISNSLNESNTILDLYMSDGDFDSFYISDKSNMKSIELVSCKFGSEVDPTLILERSWDCDCIKHNRDMFVIDVNGEENSIENLSIRSCEFVGDNRYQQAIFKGNVKKMDIQKSNFEVGINLNALKIDDHLMFNNNTLNGFISCYSTMFSEFYNEISWDQLDGQKIAVVEDLKGENSSDGIGCQSCIVYESKLDSALLDNLRYNRLITSYYQLYNIYKTRGEIESANGSYAEMKDITGNRLRAIYNRDGGLRNWINWRLNTLLKIYTNHGTDTSLPVVISIYVILLFSVLYFFFPSEWDVTSKGKLITNFKAFVSKNEHGYYKPLLPLIAGLVLSMINALTLSVNSFVTLGFGTIPTTGLARYVCIIQGLIGWFLLSIFSVTLINQVLF